MSTNQPLSDHELISKLQRKDTRALSIVYDKYAPVLYGLVIKQTNDERLASDVLQSTFAQILKECETLDCIKTRLLTWLIALTHKTALQRHQIELVKARAAAYA